MDEFKLNYSKKNVTIYSRSRRKLKIQSNSKTNRKPESRIGRSEFVGPAGTFKSESPVSWTLFRSIQLSEVSIECFYTIIQNFTGES